MRIGIIGELTRFEELKQTLPATAEIIYDEKFLPESFGNYDLIFDMNFDENFSLFDLYNSEASKTVFILSAATIELRSIERNGRLSPNIFGMNCIPTFINRKVKELSYHQESQKTQLDAIAAQLHWNIAPVLDRVGMVTPRILFMIINEAYYTLQEGTADKAAIDTAMKLGTNYPYGPFEWCEIIGIKTVVNMLTKLHNDTKDARYKICALLKSESFR